MHYKACSIAVAAMTAMAMASLLPLAPAAVAQDDVAEGQRIWADKAGCPQCHGWAGDGHVSGFDSPGGLPLRKTQLTRDQIRMTMQCGRPGTPMPHFDRFAYTDKRCYGVTAQDLGDKVPGPCREDAAALGDRCRRRLRRRQAQGGGPGNAGAMRRVFRPIRKPNAISILHGERREPEV